MSDCDWRKIIGKWPGDETDEEVEAFLNPPDAHEGMMTRREVLEALCEEWVKREQERAESSGSASAWALSALRTGRVQAYACVAGGDKYFMGDVATDAAHELALLMNAEREEAQGNE